MSDRRFRFGLQVVHPPEGEGWGAFARRVESLGFSTLFVPDHFDDQLSPFPALAAAAEATTELRVGVLVADNDYRHPVVHAKDLATIDVLSGGRLEIGIGAGWQRSDYERAGMPYDEPSRRVDRFEEGVAILKGLFADGELTFAGEHYTITALDGRPKPVQRPHPPLLIGAGGPRMLRIAAREADIVGVAPVIASGRAGDPAAAADATAAAFDTKLARLRAAAGDRFDELELNVLVLLAAETDDRAGLAAPLAASFGVSAEELLGSPVVLIGSVDEACETLQARRERWGLSYIVFQADALDGLAPAVVERLTGT